MNKQQTEVPASPEPAITPGEPIKQNRRQRRQALRDASKAHPFNGRPFSNKKGIQLLVIGNTKFRKHVDQGYDFNTGKHYTNVYLNEVPRRTSN